MVLADSTRALIGAAQLAKMKRWSFLINAARGPLIDEKALIQVLQENRIAGGQVWMSTILSRFRLIILPKAAKRSRYSSSGVCYARKLSSFLYRSG